MILLPAQIEGISSRKDKTVTIKLGTQELSPLDAANIFHLNQKFCYVAIKEEQFSQTEIEDVEGLKTDLENIKTPSQRLRAILYRNYDQNNEGYKEFSTYYQAKMDIICGHFKSKLD